MAHARAVALRILIDIEEKGAYSHIALQRLSGMESREMGLVSELVNGVTRQRLTLDFILDQFLKFPIAGLTPPIRNDLRMGAYQLLRLRVPSHAAIDEAVKLAHRYGHPGVAKLVNGVLRTLDRERDRIVLPGPEDPVQYLSVHYSLPEWIVKIWITERGFEEAEALASSAQQPSPLVLRVNTLKTTRETLLEKLGSHGIEAVPGTLPEAIRLARSVALGELPGYNDGEWYVQGEGAMLASRLLEPRPGETVLDIGAAPGGKTTHLAQLMGDEGRIIAIDVNSSRLELVKANCKRLGIHSVETVIADARSRIPWTADRILLDVPCSGLGVLSRKPDVRWHQDPQEAMKLPELQLKMLETASASLRPGGVLIYSTCTIHRAENEEVVDAFLRRNPAFHRGSLAPLLPLDWQKDEEGGMIQLLPPRHGTEGFFLARLEREAV